MTLTRWQVDPALIEVYDNGGETCDRYTVYIGSDCYLMSADADMPNGVCMYVGSTADCFRPKIEGRQIVLGELPNGALVQVIHILQHELCSALGASAAAYTEPMS